MNRTRIVKYLYTYVILFLLLIFTPRKAFAASPYTLQAINNTRIAVLDSSGYTIGTISEYGGYVSPKACVYGAKVYYCSYFQSGYRTTANYLNVYDIKTRRTHGSKNFHPTTIHMMQILVTKGAFTFLPKRLPEIIMATAITSIKRS